jgi:hypothetical protein
MVVDLGETEVLKGEVTQALYGLVGGEALFSDQLEQLAKGVGIHPDVIVDWRRLRCGEEGKINHGGHRDALGNRHRGNRPPRPPFDCAGSGAAFRG